MKLNNKNAIVTGSSKGIGKALCLALLDKGMKVAGWSRSVTDIEHENFKHVRCDVANRDSVTTALKESTGFFGEQVDVLINNAGFGAFGDIVTQPFEDWKDMFDVNVHGIFHCTQAVVKFMKAQQSGHIVNISSIAGLMGNPGIAGYAGTKFAVRGISEALYKELKTDNIKVSCVYPGSVNTHFFDEVAGTNANDTMLHPEDVAVLIINALETPDNFGIPNIEIRPMNPKYS